MLFETTLTDKYPNPFFVDDANAVELNALTMRELEDLLNIIRDTDKFLIVSVHSDNCVNNSND